MVDLERPEVALVDTDQRGPGGQGPGQLVLVVHLDQGVETEPPGQRHEPRSSSAVRAATIRSTASAPINRASAMSLARR